MLIDGDLLRAFLEALEGVEGGCFHFEWRLLRGLPTERDNQSAFCM